MTVVSLAFIMRAMSETETPEDPNEGPVPFEAEPVAAPSPATLGTRLRARREAVGLTQEKLAKQCGVSRAAVAQWEAGVTRPGLDNLVRAAKALDVWLSWLTAGDQSLPDGPSPFPSAASRRQIPVIDYVRAGLWDAVADPYAPGGGMDDIATDLDLSPKAFALVVRGESMDPEVRDGDKIIIDPEVAPQPGDFVAEVRTRRFEALTYARSSGEPEDVTLFQRARRRNISVYASEQKLASRGRFYDEDDLVDYDITDYDIDTQYFPEREWMEGRTRIKLRVKSHALGVLTLRFADSLNVSSVMSDEFGRLMFLRVRNQNSVLVNLPSAVARDFPLTLTLNYSGRMARSSTTDESVEVRRGESLDSPEQGQRSAQPDDIPLIPSEPKWLLSNRSYWYPQAQVTDYASAHIRITVPAEYGVVASGVLESGSPAAVAPAVLEGSGRVLPLVSYTFNSPQPLRYLAMLVSKMSRVDAATVALNIVAPAQPAVLSVPADTLAQQISKLVALAVSVPPVGARNTVQLAVDANKRQESRARDTAPLGADIIRLYASLVGDVPYDALTIAMVEDDLPGGHAPGYFAMINNPPPILAHNWRNDPAAFSGFPEFFMAHELAHQWFGQAVGWKNYHEQWLSEGFAQYFAALFARERRGEDAFRDILRQFRRWAVDDSDQGPVYLGYRLGHIKNESRVFRALVYNKGASVLHMLRRLIGDDAFFRGIRRYYAENRFKKAGTDDLRKAMEAESGRTLERFFERWIYDSTIPQLRFSSTQVGQELAVRFEQAGEVFDLPVLVTVTYMDGKTSEHLVALSEAVTEQRLPLTGTVRSVEVNQDGGAVAVIERR